MRKCLIVLAALGMASPAMAKEPTFSLMADDGRDVWKLDSRLTYDDCINFALTLRLIHQADNGQRIASAYCQMERSGKVKPHG